MVGTVQSGAVAVVNARPFCRPSPPIIGDGVSDATARRTSETNAHHPSTSARTYRFADIPVRPAVAERPPRRKGRPQRCDALRRNAALLHVFRPVWSALNIAEVERTLNRLS